MKDAVITVRIPREVKEQLSKYGVKVSEVVRKALEEEIERRELKEAREAAGKLGEFLARISDEEIVKGIKEARRLK